DPGQVVARAAGPRGGRAPEERREVRAAHVLARGPHVLGQHAEREEDGPPHGRHPRPPGPPRHGRRVGGHQAPEGRALTMRLMVQPDDGVYPILEAIRKARRSVDMYVFRLAYKEIEKALAAAVARGVVVRTLIPHRSGRGEKGLRKLEMRLLELGASVSRTADELLRYHGKMMVVDVSTLYVFAFNLVHTDIDRSRSLGV